LSGEGQQPIALGTKLSRQKPRRNEGCQWKEELRQEDPSGSIHHTTSRCRCQKTHSTLSGVGCVTIAFPNDRFSLFMRSYCWLTDTALLAKLGNPAYLAKVIG
jgi:hypothetical protein